MLECQNNKDVHRNEPVAAEIETDVGVGSVGEFVSTCSQYVGSDISKVDTHGLNKS